MDESRSSMVTYIVVGIVGGLLFGVMDGLINANPYAQRLLSVYKPLARTAINVPAGIVIDLVYGFTMTGLYVILYDSLPGDTGLAKGICYALVVWFFRVVMSAVSTWMTLTVPVKVHLYTTAAGLGEMLVLGVLFGLTLDPI